MKLKTVNDFLAWSMSSKTIAFKAIYAQITGDIIAGLLLSQIIFWHLPSENGKSKLRIERNGRFWIAKKRTDWVKEIWISDRQYDRVIKHLSKDDEGKGLGVVDVEIYKFSGVNQPHIALNYDVLFALLNKQLAKYAKQGNDITYKKPKKIKDTKNDKYKAKVDSYLSKQSEEYREVFSEFKNYRKKKNPMTNYAEYLMLNDLEKFFPKNPAEHIKRFKKSIMNGWLGVIFDNEKDLITNKTNPEGYC